MLKYIVFIDFGNAVLTVGHIKIVRPKNSNFVPAHIKAANVNSESRLRPAFFRRF